MTAAEYYIQKGQTKGNTEGKIEVAINALQKDFDVEMVVDLTGLDIKVVQQLKDELDS